MIDCMMIDCFTQDFTFMQTLEMHLRNEAPPLCGRDHLAFRSQYWPAKVHMTCVCARTVIDGD